VLKQQHERRLCWNPLRPVPSTTTTSPWPLPARRLVTLSGLRPQPHLSFIQTRSHHSSLSSNPVIDSSSKLFTQAIPSLYRGLAGRFIFFDLVTAIMSAAPKRKRTDNKFYAVRIGKKAGLYHNWNDCLEQVKGFKGAVCKYLISSMSNHKYRAKLID
jgi:hypothetical protein